MNKQNQFEYFVVGILISLITLLSACDVATPCKCSDGQYYFKNKEKCEKAAREMGIDKWNSETLRCIEKRESPGFSIPDNALNEFLSEYGKFSFLAPDSKDYESKIIDSGIYEGSEKHMYKFSIAKFYCESQFISIKKNSANDQLSRNEIINDIIEKEANGIDASIKSIAPIKKNNLEGFEYVYQKFYNGKSVLLKSRMFYENGNIYSISIGCQEKYLEEQFVNKYLESLKINRQPEAVVQPLISEQKTSPNDKSFMFGGVEFNLPNYKEFKECWDNPVVKRNLSQLESNGNVVLGFYVNENEYPQVVKEEIEVIDEYIKIYSIDDLKDIKITEPDLKMAYKQTLQIFNSQRIGQLQEMINNKFSDLSVDRPVLLENYEVNNNIKSAVFLNKYNVANNEYVQVSVMNMINIKNKLIYCCYYKNYSGTKSINLIKSKSDYFCLRLLKENSGIG